MRKPRCAHSAFPSRGCTPARPISSDYSAAFAQQNGFVHAGIITAGLDNSCGIAAYTLMAPDAAILTVEFKTNLLAPATRERFVFRAQVVKPGRTLTVCEARAYAIDGIRENLVASMTGTLMAPMSREERETEKPATAVA